MQKLQPALLVLSSCPEPSRQHFCAQNYRGRSSCCAGTGLNVKIENFVEDSTVINSRALSLSWSTYAPSRPDFVSVDDTTGSLSSQPTAQGFIREKKCEIVFCFPASSSSLTPFFLFFFALVPPAPMMPNQPRHRKQATSQVASEHELHCEGAMTSCVSFPKSSSWSPDLCCSKTSRALRATLGSAAPSSPLTAPTAPSSQHHRCHDATNAKKEEGKLQPQEERTTRKQKKPRSPHPHTFGSRLAVARIGAH